MSTNTTYSLNAERPFIADPHSIDRTNGAQVDWSEWGVGYQNSAGKKVLPAGTICALSSNQLVPPAAGGADAACILATPAIEDSNFDAQSGYGVIVGGVIYSNLLPDADHADFAAMLTALKVAGVGTGYKFLTYADSRDA